MWVAQSPDPQCWSCHHPCWVSSVRSSTQVAWRPVRCCCSQTCRSCASRICWGNSGLVRCSSSLTLPLCLPGCVALVALAGIGIATCQLHHTTLAKGLVMQILYTCLQIAIHCGLLWWRWWHNGRRCWGVVRFNAGRFKAMLIVGISWCARSPRCCGGRCGLVGWEAIAA